MELSTLYPQLFCTYPHVIHSLSTILSTFFPNVVDIFYRLLSSSLLKFFIIFSIISLYGLIGSFLENYHIPTSGVTNDWQIKGKLGCHKRHPEGKLWYFKGILRYLDCPYGNPQCRQWPGLHLGRYKRYPQYTRLYQEEVQADSWDCHWGEDRPALQCDLCYFGGPWEASKPHCRSF